MKYLCLVYFEQKLLDAFTPQEGEALTRDLNEAIQIAAGIPLAKLGSIEVRPIMPLKG